MPAYPYQSYQNPYQQGFYQNPYYMQQQIQMPQMQQAQPQPQTSQQTVQASGIIWVSGDEEALAFPVAPNTAVRLWHSTLPVVYFKQADASGKPTMKIYDLVEHKAIQKEEKKIDFATKEEVASLDSSIQLIKNEIKLLKKEMKRKEPVEDDDE